MEADELKRKLLGLWEKTSHTSKDLLAQLFDYYFDMKYVEYQESEGKVISAICGIPYSFGSERNPLKGLYFIVLSSEEGYRKKGILSELLTSFNKKIKEEFDFSFLMPHTDLLADYYGTQGYQSSFFILEERFTPLHDFKKDYQLTLSDSDERIRKLKEGLIEELEIKEVHSSVNLEDDKEKQDIITFIKNTEKAGNSAVNLRHTTKDLEYILQENSIRNLKAFVAYDSDKKITGVAFIQKEELKRIRVVAFYVDDMCSYYALLDFIKRQFPDYSLSINTSDPKYQSHALVQQVYASSNPKGGDLDNTFSMVEIPFNFNKLLHPMGMVKLLNFQHILEYLAESRSDADFKLFIRNNKNDLQVNGISNQKDEVEDREAKYKIYEVKNGKLEIQYEKEVPSGKTILNLSEKEVAELLLRKNDSSTLIMEAFGIPRLNLQTRLLPC